MKRINPTIILVRPQLPENIGMTARAMDNFGLSRLYLVNPRDEWPNNKAEKSAKHAEGIIKSVQIFSNLAEATSQFNLVIATTNRQRFLTKKKFHSSIFFWLGDLEKIFMHKDFWEFFGGGRSCTK